MWTLDCFSQSGLYGSFYAYYGPGRSNDPVSTAYALFKVGGGIICETLYATSSKKIKNIIGSVNIDNLRERFSKIKFQEYTHKDVFLRGDRLNYGVIAEQLNESFPEFVQLDNQDFIPNFLRLADTCSIFGKFLTLTFRNPIPELEGEKLKIFVGNSSYTPKIVDYNDASISVFFEDDAEWNLVTAAINNGESVFVYGTFEKCPAVIKEKLFEVGMILLQDAMIKIDNLNKK